MKNLKRTFKQKIINAFWVVLSVAMIVMACGAIAFKIWLDISWKLSIIG